MDPSSLVPDSVPISSTIEWLAVFLVVGLFAIVSFLLVKVIPSLISEMRTLGDRLSATQKESTDKIVSAIERLERLRV